MLQDADEELQDAGEDEPEWVFALNMSQRDEDDYLSSADTWRALTLLDWD